MEHSLDLSIIIVCTNEKKFLSPNLKSLAKNLDGISHEIIIVDNASTDGSRELIKAQFPQVTLIENQKNRGAAFARNRGVEKARGDYLLFLDCDTEVLEQSILKLLEYLQNHQQIGTLSPRLLYPDHRLQYSSRFFPNLLIFFFRLVWDGDIETLRNTSRFRRLQRYFMIDWDHNDIREVDWTMSACWMLRRNVFEQLHGFDEQYFYNYEDVDFAWRIKKTGLKNVYYPEAEVVHYYQRLSANKSFFNPLKWSHLKSAIRFLIKKTLS